MTVHPLQANFEEWFLYSLFSILKDPQLSLVCQFWHKINSSPKSYELILKMYNQQHFMARFSTKLPLRNEEYISRVKEIFIGVQT